MRVCGALMAVGAVVSLSGCGNVTAPSVAEHSVTQPAVIPFSGTPDDAMTLQLERGVTVQVRKVLRNESDESSVGISRQGDEVMVLDTGGFNESRTEGVVRLGEHGQSNWMGVTASDLTTTFHRTDVPEDMRDIVSEELADQRSRIIKTGEDTEYVQPASTGQLPAGKTWYRDDRDYECAMKSALGSFSLSELVQAELIKNMVTLAAPPVPGEELDGVPTTVYAGTAPIRKLGGTASFSDAMNLDMYERADKTITVSWKLSVGPDQLPRRMTLSTPIPPVFQDDAPATAVTEVTFAAWGAPMNIVAPPADQVHVLTEGTRGCIEMGE